MAFLLRGAFCKKRPSKIFAGSAGEKSVENRAGKGPVFLVLPAKNIAAHLKILFIATLKSGSHNGNQMHVSCLRCSRKGMRLDDRKISKRKRRCNHEKNKRMQALLSTAMCAAILFSNAAAVFAAEVPPLPRKEGENPLAEQSPVNLLRQPGAASSYQYGEDALYNMSNLDLLGSDVSSLDLDCQKLTDGVKSSAGSIDFDSVVNFYSNSAFNNAENGAKFSNQNTVDFDLGQPKTIVEVNAYSSAGLTGRYAGSLGHIGKYSVYVSADKNQWTCVLDGKNCGEDISEQTGAYVARYAVSADKVPGHPDATGIYAQYVRILFETNGSHKCIGAIYRRKQSLDFVFRKNVGNETFIYMRRRVECTWSIIAIAVQILTKNSHIRNPKTLRGFVFVRSLFLPLLQQFFRNGRYTQLFYSFAFLLIIQTLESPPIVNSGNRAQSLV